MQKYLTDLTADYVRHRLLYEPVTGEFTHRYCPELGKGWNAKHAGMRAGCLDNNGYRKISINKCMFAAHRLAWLYMTGDWPTEQIDHINMDKADNRFCNLREASQAQNRMNVGRRHSKSGRKGVAWDKQTRGWMASIKANGVHHHLGRFKNIENAAEAYRKACLDLHGEFARIE